MRPGKRCRCPWLARGRRKPIDMERKQAVDDCIERMIAARKRLNLAHTPELYDAAWWELVAAARILVEMEYGPI
jgi:hypothetical protein